MRFNFSWGHQELSPAPLNGSTPDDEAVPRFVAGCRAPHLLGLLSASQRKRRECQEHGSTRGLKNGYLPSGKRSRCAWWDRILVRRPPPRVPSEGRSFTTLSLFIGETSGTGALEKLLFFEREQSLNTDYPERWITWLVVR